MSYNARETQKFCWVDARGYIRVVDHPWSFRAKDKISLLGRNSVTPLCPGIELTCISLPEK